MDLDDIAKLAQNCFQRNPVLVLGSGASLPHGIPGMGALTDHLLANVQPDEANETTPWESVRDALIGGMHLEQALLDQKDLPASLIEKIVRETWLFIEKADDELLINTIKNNSTFPLTSLFQSLLAGVNRTLNVITTNYDRVAEYASNAGRLLYSTGFSPGYIQYREGSESITIYRGRQVGRTVRIWKVHGSLDWFERTDGMCLSIPNRRPPTESLSPLIVTPGVSKFERTHNEPFRSVIGGADRALEHANGYICIGFGFRDSHIEPKLVERCHHRNVPIVVLARSLTDEAKRFLREQAGRNYLALEKNDDATRAYSAQTPDGTNINVSFYWSLDQFMNLIT